MLTVIRHGSPGALPPLMIAHGLFGSARNWGAIAARMATDRLVLAVDMRNHGSSPWFKTHSYPELAADLAGVIRAEGLPMDVLGHSMGGKAAMVLALTEPALIRKLVVADIAPVAYAHTQMPLVRAMQALDLSDLTSRGEADRRLAASVPDDSTRAFLLQSLDLKSVPPRWRLNLDVLAAGMDGILSWPYGPDASPPPFAGPVLFLTGGLSAYVRPEHRDRIKALFPKAKFARIPGAGHWLHAEQPRAFVETLRVFLS